MNTIKVITELSAEDRKRIEDLTGAIALLTSIIGSTLPKKTQESIIAEATEPTITELSADAEKDSRPPLEVPNEAEAYVEDLQPVAEPEPVVKPVSLAEFQKAVTMAVSKGAEAKAAVKTIINKYAASVSAVPEDKRADIIAELSNI